MTTETPRRARGRAAALLLSAVAVAVVIASVVGSPSGGGEAPVADASGTLTLTPPSGWDDLERRGVDVEGAVAPYLEVAPDRAAYHDDATAPGAEVLLVETAASPAALLDRTVLRGGVADACERTRAAPLERNGLAGVAHVYSCGDGVEQWVFAAALDAPARVLLVSVRSTDAAEREHVLSHFQLA